MGVAVVELMVEKEMPKNLRKETPDGQPVELYDYQKDGLGWLRYLDVSNRGGVLADEMGLGKTVQVISLICDEDFRTKNVCRIVVHHA